MLVDEVERGEGEREVGLPAEGGHELGERVGVQEVVVVELEHVVAAGLRETVDGIAHHPQVVGAPHVHDPGVAGRGDEVGGLLRPGVVADEDLEVDVVRQALSEDRREGLSEVAGTAKCRDHHADARHVYITPAPAGPLTAPVASWSAHVDVVVWQRHPDAGSHIPCG